MDEYVSRAVARWPDVAAVFGWLGLDRRGRWRIHGETVANRTATRFIDRNYAADRAGCWYFQNGPQRVYVQLDYTPWVYSLDGAGRAQTHTAAPVRRINGAWLDEQANLLIDTEYGIGAFDDRDLAAVSERFRDHAGAVATDALVEAALEAVARADPDCALRVDLGTGAVLSVGVVSRADVAARFGFVQCPAQSDVG